MIERELLLMAAVVVRTAIVFALLVIGLRLTGKRQIGEMDSNDLVFVLVIANAVQNAMTAGNGSLTVALASACTLLFIGWLLSALLVRYPSLREVFGEPTVLVENGHILRRVLRREGVTENELMAAVRDEGLGDVTDVKLAVLEIGGEISVVPRAPADKS